MAARRAWLRAPIWPRRFCSGAIETTPLHANALSRSTSSIAGRKTRKTSSFQGSTGGFRRCFVEYGETCAIESGVALLDFLGERLRQGQARAILRFGAAQHVGGLARVIGRSDLNFPAVATGGARLLRLGDPRFFDG